MIDPEDADYECTLCAASVELARVELNEEPKERLGCVQTLRKWIREQQHMSCRTDTEFLLSVLRTAKFSQLRAREIIEAILTWRTKYPQYLVNIDSHEPAIVHHIKRGSLVPLPKPDKEGRSVTIIRISGIDMNDPRITVAAEVRANVAVELILKERNEEIIVNGEHVIFDMTGVSAKHVQRSLEADKNVHKMFQECNLGRLKGLHFYNGGTFFEVLMGIVRPFIKKKYLERVTVHNTLESLYKLFPMELWPDDYLPDDYKGPSAGSVSSIVDNLTKKLLDPGFRDRLLEYTSDRWKIDENYMKQAGSLPRPESFRKLNIDE